MSGLLSRTLIGTVEIKEKSGYVFHEFFMKRPHDIPSVNDEFIHGCDLHEGAFGTSGSTIEWTYTVDGQKKTIKQILGTVDEENKIMVFNCIGGDLIKDYDNFVATFQVVPVSEGVCKVIWTFTYDKKVAGFPEPTGEMDALVNIAKQICDHHHATN